MSLDPHSRAAMVNLASLARQNGDLTRARRLLARVVQQAEQGEQAGRSGGKGKGMGGGRGDPDLPRILCNYGNVCLQDGDAEEAVRLYTRALSLSFAPLRGQVRRQRNSNPCTLKFYQCLVSILTIFRSLSLTFMLVLYFTLESLPPFPIYMT